MNDVLAGLGQLLASKEFTNIILLEAEKFPANVQKVIWQINALYTTKHLSRKVKKKGSKK